MNLINLTSKSITIVSGKGYEVLNLLPSGIIVAASIAPKVLDTVVADGEEIEIVTYCYDNVSALPEPRPDTLYIVTYAVLQALKGSRSDVVAPDTSPTSIIRQDGKVVGVQKLRKL